MNVACLRMCLCILSVCHVFTCCSQTAGFRCVEDVDSKLSHVCTKTEFFAHIVLVRLFKVSMPGCYIYLTHCDISLILTPTVDNKSRNNLFHIDIKAHATNQERRKSRVQ